MEINEDKGQVLLFNKPLGFTSFQVVKKVRNLTKVKKVGHAGTLDPLATGLLVLCLGKATKKISVIQDAEKEYTGTITLGSSTPSYDLETSPENFIEMGSKTLGDLTKVAANLTGEIMQSPPLYSAIKLDGERAYNLARAGDTRKVEARPVTIKEFEITTYQYPIVAFRIVCSKGTYIRSIANDFGKLLGGAAHLSSLIRTRIGDLHLRDAFELKAFEENCKQNRDAQ